MKCYKFTDQETFYSLLPPSFFSEDGQLICYTHNYSIQELGPVEITPVVIKDEKELGPAIVVADHHVNYQGALIPELEPYHIRYCDKPSTVWAGVSAETAPPKKEEA